jgi:hypothetical protein
MGGAMLLLLVAAWRPASDRHQRAVGFASMVLVVITLGLVVWRHRPESRSGILLTAAPLAYALSQLPVVMPRSPLAVTVGLAAIQLNAAVFAHVFLSYPTGRIARRVERGFVRLGYLFALAYALPLLLFYDPRAPYDEGILQCPACARPLTHVSWRDVSELTGFLDAVLLALIVGFVAVLVRKVVRAAAGERRTLLPLVVAGCMAAAELGVQIAVVGFDASMSFWTSSGTFWIETAAVVAVPAVLAAGLLWRRTAQPAVAGRHATAAVAGLDPRQASRSV